MNDPFLEARIAADRGREQTPDLSLERRARQDFTRGLTETRAYAMPSKRPEPERTYPWGCEPPDGEPWWRQ